MRADGAVPYDYFPLKKLTQFQRGPPWGGGVSECHMWSRVEKRCAIGGEGPAAAGGNASRSRRRRAAKGAKAKQIDAYNYCSSRAT